MEKFIDDAVYSLRCHTWNTHDFHRKYIIFLSYDHCILLVIWNCRVGSSM